MAEKIIRDPVHDVIAFRTDCRGDALLFSLVNTMEFQRLRRIHQLGLASLAYPGADHSRYSHSLGVMETARKMLHRLADFFPIPAEDQLLCAVAALLHDLGHGPFSHTFERVTGIEHEGLTRRLILDPESQVHQVLVAHDPTLPPRIVALLNCETPGQSRPATRTFLHDILSSQLDADRFDYLLRDNLMTGSRYGYFDLGWLLQALVIDEATGRLAVTAKGISAVEDYLQSRYHMYRNVYFHKVVRSAEGMVKLALQRARRLAVQERLPWPPRDHSVHKALLGQQLSNAEFAELDDISMMMCFKQWSRAEDATLAQLCHGLLYRRLYKVVDLSSIADAEQARAVYLAAESAIARAGGDPAYDLFFDEPANTPFPATSSSPACDTDSIFIRDAAGQLTDFSKTSPIAAALDRQLMFRRIHVREEWKPLIV
jgi:HD superfamily phosphohydrolase